MKKILCGLCVACLLIGCAADGAAEEPSVPVMENTAEVEQTEVPAATETEQEAETDLRELFEIKAEGIDYLSVEGITLPEGSVVAMIGKDSKSNFWKKVKEGAEQAVADLNAALGYTGDGKVKLLYDAPEKEDVAEQIDIIDQILDKNPDVLCVGFVDVNCGKTQLDLAQANGIPVLAVDSGVENSLLVSSIGTDNYQAGAEAARELCEAIGDAGKVALLVHSSLTESGIDREKGFKEEIENHHPEVELVQTAYWQQEERTMDEIVAAVLQEHPDLKAFFGTNDAVTKELLNALDLYNAEELTVLAAGFDASAKEIQAVVDDKMAGVMAQNPWGMGYAAAVSSFRAAAGMENAAEVDTGHYWIGVHNLEEELSQMLIYK